MKSARMVMASLIAALLLGVVWLSTSRGRASFLPAGLFPEARVSSPLVEVERKQSPNPQKQLSVKTNPKLSNKNTDEITEPNAKPREPEVIKVPVRPGERLVGANAVSNNEIVAQVSSRLHVKQNIEPTQVAGQSESSTQTISAVRSTLPIRSTDSGYVVLVASYTNLKYAQVFFEKLVANNIPAQISEGEIVRISAGPYSNETTARDAANQIAALMN